MALPDRPGRHHRPVGGDPVVVSTALTLENAALTEAIIRYWEGGTVSGTNVGQGEPGCRRAQRDAFVAGAVWSLRGES